MQEEKKPSKPLNKDNFFGKVNNEMINSSFDEAQQTLRRIVESDPKNAKTIIASISKIIIEQEIPVSNTQYLIQSELDDQDRKDIINRVNKILGDNFKVKELRNFAIKASRIINVPITDLVLNKPFLLGWFKDNIDTIEKAKEKGLFD